MNFVRSNLCDNEENNEFLFLKKSFLRSDETMYNIFKCAKCKVSFADQEQIDKIDLQKIYDEYFSDEKHKKKLENPNANRKYWLKQSKTINKLYPKGGRILDIGCNAGHFLYFLKGNWEKHGVELSQYAANIAKNKNLEIFNGYLEDAKYSSDYFDVITLYAVIDHVEYPSELLDAIKRVLKHNGLCVIMTGDKDSITAKFKKENWHMYSPPLHLYFFSHESLDIFMREKMFEKIKSIYTDGGMTSCRNKYINYGIRLLLTAMEKIPYLNEIPIFDHMYSYYKLFKR